MKRVYLSFDFEECDLPREHGVDFPIEEGMRYSIEGAQALLDVLEKHGIRATFFCTLNFAERAPAVMERLVLNGHEIAAHGVDHFHQTQEDPIRCKAGLERLCGVKVVGYRQPRMFPVDDAGLLRAGYLYNSSLNPAFVPGRYNHWDVPRRPFYKKGLLQIPASVTPIIRFPLFWLALHLLPEGLYRLLVLRTLKHDGRVITYFHPWEFSSLGLRADELKIPALIRPHLGRDMTERLDCLVYALARRGVEFGIMNEMVQMFQGERI